MKQHFGDFDSIVSPFSCCFPLYFKDEYLHIIRKDIFHYWKTHLFKLHFTSFSLVLFWSQYKPHQNSFFPATIFSLIWNIALFQRGKFYKINWWPGTHKKIALTERQGTQTLSFCAVHVTNNDALRAYWHIHISCQLWCNNKSIRTLADAIYQYFKKKYRKTNAVPIFGKLYNNYTLLLFPRDE